MSSNDLQTRRSRYSDRQYQNSSIYHGSVKSSLNNLSVDLPKKPINSIQRQYLNRQKQSQRTIINLTYTKYAILQQVCSIQNLNWKVQTFGQTKHWSIKWCDTGVTNQILNKMHYLQKINHFPAMNVISRKNNLALTLTKMKQLFPHEYNFYPRTFLYPKESSKVLHYYVQSRKKGLLKTFIVKPQAGCQGKGIFLTQNYAQIQKQQQCIVQKYISNPMLFQGLKFDLRIYVLLSSINPLRIHLYNQGLVRFATEKYKFPLHENLNNLYMHLTNYAINKSNPDYQYNYSINDMAFGHKKSLAQFFKILKDLGFRANSYWSQIKDSIIKTLIAGQPMIYNNYRSCRNKDFTNNMCFQVLGFDFMIDNRDRCYLLQVNHTPSFTTDTPLDHIIKKNLIKDTLLMMNYNADEVRLMEQLQRSKQKDKYNKSKGRNTGMMRQNGADNKDKDARELEDYRQLLMKQIARQREVHQQTFKGTYELIFPSKNSVKQANYQKLMAASYRSFMSPGNSQSRQSQSSSNIRSILLKSSSNSGGGNGNKLLVSKQNLAKINEQPQLNKNQKKNIIYSYNYLKGNSNKKALSTLPNEIIGSKPEKNKNEKFIRVSSSSQKLKLKTEASQRSQQKQTYLAKNHMYYLINSDKKPRDFVYKSEEKNSKNLASVQSRSRIKTNVISGSQTKANWTGERAKTHANEERQRVNMLSNEISNFTKRIKAYRTPFM